MTAFRRTVGVAALCAVLMLNAGCQSDGEAQPLPPADSSSTTPTETNSSSPSSTGSTQPAWQDKYSKKQIAAYEAALERFETYEQRSEPIWRRGKATPAAEELFKEYFYTWQSQFATLERYEQVNVEIHGTPTVLRSRATRIALDEGGQSVTIRQCVDFTTSTLMQDGEPAPGASKKPALRSVVLSRSVRGADSVPFKITAIQITERRCS